MLFQVFRNLSSRLKSERSLLWLIRITSIFFGLLVLYTILFKYSETVSWEEAIWQSWQTLTTVGYGNRPAETTFGRWMTIIVATMGIAVLGAVFTAVFDYRQNIVEKRRIGLMKNPFENGYVIFNYPGDYQLMGFINELRSVEKNVGICIVDSSIEELPTSIARLDRVHFIRGSTLSRTTYEQAAICENKAVIVFPKQWAVSDSDGSTKTVVSLLSKFVQGKTRILHVLVDPSNAWMFEDVDATQVLEGFEFFALVQECQDQYSSGIVEQLLLNTKGANPRTFSADPLSGWTWGQLLHAASQIEEPTSLQCNPFAIIKKHKPNVCPPYSEQIEKGDFLSIIAHHEFDWEAFVKKAQHIRKQ